MKKLNEDMIKTEFNCKYLKVYDMQYEENFHYYNASRRKKENLIALKDEQQKKEMMADAVCCIVIYWDGQKEKLILQKEFRYPVNTTLLSITAGMIDEDENELEAAQRELKEETGLQAKKIFMVNPLVYTTPGMTDESNSFVCCIVDDLSSMSNNNLQDIEEITDYCLIDKQQAGKLLKNGRDDDGNFYPLHTFAALLYFISDLWKSEI